MSAVEVAAVAYLLWGGRAYQIVPPAEGVPTDLYQTFYRALIDAYVQTERSPDLFSIEESVSGSKLYDLDKGVKGQDEKTYRFEARDLTIRSDLNLTAEVNLDPNSRFTVEGGIPYTNSAMRRIRQLRITTTALTAVKVQLAGINLGVVSP